MCIFDPSRPPSRLELYNPFDNTAGLVVTTLAKASEVYTVEFKEASLFPIIIRRKEVIQKTIVTAW